MTKPDLQIEMLVRVSDDSFESKFSFPVGASPTDIDRLVKLWLEAMRTAVALAQANAGVEP